MLFMFCVTLVALVEIVSANFGAGHFITAGLGTVLFVLAIALKNPVYSITAFLNSLLPFINKHKKALKPLYLMISELIF